MIARIWHGKTLASDANEYLSFLLERAVPDYESVEGCYKATVLRRINDEEAHFLPLSIWESKDALKQFAGTEIDEAQYYVEDESYLLEFEPTVHHHDTFPKGF